jgi:hypothetical protein
MTTALNPAVASSLGIMPGTTGNADPSSTMGIAGATGITLGTGTGQQGLLPQASGGGGMMEAVQDVWQWLNTPFKSPMAPTDVFLLVGTVLVALILWNLILYHIRIASESL